MPAYLVLLQSTAGTFTVGRVCEATGSMVSVLSSTAARTRAESCSTSRKSSETLGDWEPMGWVPSWPPLAHLTSCTVKSRQGPTSSRYTLSRKGQFLSRVGDALQAWNSANRVVST